MAPLMAMTPRAVHADFWQVQAQREVQPDDASVYLQVSIAARSVSAGELKISAHVREVRGDGNGGSVLPPGCCCCCLLFSLLLLLLLFLLLLWLL